MSIANTLTNRHTIASYFARAHLGNAVYLGAQEKDVLEQAGLTAELLKHTKSRILASQLASIIRTSWRLSGDELLGLTQQKMKVGMFALLTERLICCKNLEDVLMQTARFYNLSGEQVNIVIARKNSQVRFNVQTNFKNDPHNPTPNSLLTELLLLLFHRLICWLVGQVIPLKKVSVQHPKPSHHEEYRLMFGCACDYQSEYDALVFDEKYLKLPVTRNEIELAEYLKEVPLQWFKKQSYYDTCSAKVIRILEEAALEGTALEGVTNIEGVAAKLNMTSRTLRRKLTAEGSRFQDLKDNARRDQAISLFEDSRLTIAEIGRLVGFTEPATFTRAFKQWTGVSPSTYRSHSSAQGYSKSKP